LATSFDHLVGACEQRWRHGEVERLAVLTLMSNSNFVLIIDQSVQPITNPIRLTALQRIEPFFRSLDRYLRRARARPGGWRDRPRHGLHHQYCRI
jgi:hypothetical protein